MKDPRRLRADESVAPELRELIGRARAPRALPAAVRARNRAAIQRRLRRQRVWTWTVTGAGVAAGAGVFLAYRLPPPAPAEVADRPARGQGRDFAAEPPPAASPATHQAPACADCLLVPSRAGWLERSSNRFGAQGYFYVDASTGSTVLEPARPARGKQGGWSWLNDGKGRLCLKGSSAAVLNGNYQTHWGVVAGLELCHTGRTGDPPGRTFSITDCPWGELGTLQGVRFSLDGPDIPSELRVVFSEIGSNENAFVALSDAARGRHEVLMADARVSYQEPPRPVRRDKVRGVEWLIPSRLGKAAEFDFCIAQIELF